MSKNYAGRDGHPFLALKDVNLEVRSGEFLSIIGPSGSGKTTLLKCIDGLTPFTSGRIELASSSSNALRDRAFVFQDFGLLPWRTVLANVAFPLELLGWNRRERTERAMSFIKLVGLEQFAHHHPHELSGGMRQRVGLTRALVVDPAVLLMDEPLGALDEQTREVMQTELLDICANSGKTVIFVTHSVDEAVFMSDRVAVMTTSPGTVKTIVDIAMPRPRTRLSTRADPRFSEYRTQIWEELGLQDVS